MNLSENDVQKTRPYFWISDVSLVRIFFAKKKREIKIRKTTTILEILWYAHVMDL